MDMEKRVNMSKYHMGEEDWKRKIKRMGEKEALKKGEKEERGEGGYDVCRMSCLLVHVREGRIAFPEEA